MFVFVDEAAKEVGALELQMGWRRLHKGLHTHCMLWIVQLEPIEEATGLQGFCKAL